MTTTANTMTITIRHNQNSIDPAGTYTDEQFEEVIAALESEYERELKKEFPDAEIGFERSDDAYAHSVSGIDDYREKMHAEDEVQRVCELVYETGLFGAKTQMKTHGGARKGAGRKPRLVPLQALTVRIEPALAARFRALCKRRGVSQAKQVAEWIENSVSPPRQSRVSPAPSRPAISRP